MSKIVFHEMLKRWLKSKPYKRATQPEMPRVTVVGITIKHLGLPCLYELSSCYRACVLRIEKSVPGC